MKARVLEPSCDAIARFCLRSTHEKGIVPSMFLERSATMAGKPTKIRAPGLEA